jgi:hypothetical protein
MRTLAVRTRRMLFGNVGTGSGWRRSVALLMRTSNDPDYPQVDFEGDTPFSMRSLLGADSRNGFS